MRKRRPYESESGGATLHDGQRLIDQYNAVGERMVAAGMQWLKSHPKARPVFERSLVPAVNDDARDMASAVRRIGGELEASMGQFTWALSRCCRLSNGQAYWPRKEAQEGGVCAEPNATSSPADGAGQS